MHIKIHSEYPLFVFSFDSNISASECQSLRKDINDLKFTKSDSGNKYRLEHNDNEVFRITKTNLGLRKLTKYFKNHNFQKTIKDILEKNSKNSVKYSLLSLNPLLNLYNFFILKREPLRLNFEFSLMSKGSFIAPHTDSRNKVFTMMLYLPESPAQEKKRIGTVFYKPQFDKELKYSNFNNIHADNGNYPNFAAENSIIFRTKFTYKKIYGFIKTDLSWHGVEKLELDPKERRISININYYKCNKSIFGPLIELFKKYLKSSLWDIKNKIRKTNKTIKN